MVLVLSTQQLADMSAHAERVYPEECCGLMLGKLTTLSEPQSTDGQSTDGQSTDGQSTDGQSTDRPSTNGERLRQKQLVELVPLNNEWTPEAIVSQPSSSAAVTTSQGLEVDTHTKHRRYWIDPQDMLRVQREAREKGLNIIGIYHSHPDHVAEPSECDRALAWAEYAYAIVSVCEGKAVDVRNWALDSKHQFQSEAMKVSPSSATDRMPVSA